VREPAKTEQWAKWPCGSIEMGWRWILGETGITETSAVESGQVAHIPLGNEEGGIVVCVSMRMRSVWRNEARLRMRLGFGPARPLVLLVRKLRWERGEGLAEEWVLQELVSGSGVGERRERWDLALAGPLGGRQA